MEFKYEYPWHPLASKLLLEKLGAPVEKSLLWAGESKEHPNSFAYP